MTGPGPYRTIARIRKPQSLGIDDPGNDPGRTENEGSDDAKASDVQDAKEDAKEDAEASDDDAKDNGSDNSLKSVGTDTSDNSRRKMARSKPKPVLKPPPSERQVEALAAEEQSNQDEAVKWYEDVLGFPEPCAKALYIEQTLTDR